LFEYTGVWASDRLVFRLDEAPTPKMYIGLYIKYWNSGRLLMPKNARFMKGKM
jgi:hypothetical protein